VPATQKQFDALTSVAYNSPRAANVLMQKLNKLEALTRDDFINSLLKGYDSQQGLINRRSDEAAFFGVQR
jgi:GH24 family phage-related lysozyme (muramidase)